MAPTWLTALAWFSLRLAFLVAGAIAYDIFGRGHRQKMWIMEAVRPLIALYAGPLAWWAYRCWGRLSSPKYQQETRRAPDYGEAVSVGIGVSHCGAGCALGDTVGEFVIFAFGAEIIGLAKPS